MSVIETLIVTTALAGVAGTGLGGLIGAMLQKDSNRTVSLLLSFAGGVMLRCGHLDRGGSHCLRRGHYLLFELPHRPEDQSGGAPY